MLVGDVFAQMGLDDRKYRKGLINAEKLAGQSGKRAGGVFTQAMGFTLGQFMFRTLRAGFKAVTSTAIDFNAQLQTATMGFEQMLGSAGRAKKFMDELTDFAARTPFEFPGLLEASRRMLAMQWDTERIFIDLQTIGDTLAGIGKFGPESIGQVVNALGRMKMYGRISAREMMMLINAGIPAWQILAEEMDSTTAEVRKMVQKGLIPAEVATEKILAGMEKRFGGMMGNLETSWQGVVATIKDAWNLSVGEMTKSLFQGVNKWLVKVKTFAQEFHSALKEGGVQFAFEKMFGENFARSVQAFTDRLKSAWYFFAEFINTIKRNWGVFAPYIKQALLFAVAIKFIGFVFNASSRAAAMFSFIQKILAGDLIANTGFMGFLSTAATIYQGQMAGAAISTGFLTGALYSLRAAIYSVWVAIGPIGWAIIALSAAIGGGMVLWNSYTKSLQKVPEIGKDIEDSTDDANSALEEQADALQEVGKAASKNLQSFDEVHQLQEDMGDGAGLEDFFGDMDMEEPVLDIPGLKTSMTDLMDELESLKPTFSGFWNWLKEGAGNVWESVKVKWGDFWKWAKDGNLWEWMKEKWAKGIEWIKGLDMWDWITKKTENLRKSVSEIWRNLEKTILNIHKAIDKATFGVWGNIVDGLLRQWNALWKLAGTVFGAIRDVILGKISMKEAVMLIWEGIKTYFKDTWENIKITTENIWTDLSGGLKQKWENIKETARSVWGALTSTISTGWANIKTGALNVWGEINKKLAETWYAIKNTARSVWDGIGDVIRGAINAVIKFINKFIDGWNKIELGIPKIDIPGLGKLTGWSIGLPYIRPITPLAKGGVVTGPTFAMLGESGSEAVIPLGQSGFANEIASAIYEAAYNAIRDAFRVTEKTGSEEDREVVLEIDGMRIARAILPPLVKEGQRTGVMIAAKGV